MNNNMNINSKSLFFFTYKTNNKLIGNISMKNILEQKICVPNEQRIRDDDKVNEIIKYQDDFFKKNFHFNFLGLINIHYCIEDDKNYLVDGQHRYKAMEKLYREHGYKDFSIDIEVVTVNNKEELKHNYGLVNKNTELSEFPDNIDKQIPEKVSQYFFNEFANIWTKKKRNIRPLLNKNNFQEAVGYLLSKLKEIGDYDVEDLKRVILEKNEKLKNWSVESYNQNIRKIKKWPVHMEKCKSHKIYLGMYNHTNEEYCYDWVKDIVREITGEHLKKAKKQTKASIPKNLKNRVWEKYNGNKANAICYCCDIKKIHLGDTWDCGHVKSEYNGGLLVVDNLRPICGNCNKTMGTTHMYEFMKKNYPERHKRLTKPGFFNTFLSF